MSAIPLASHRYATSVALSVDWPITMDALITPLTTGPPPHRWWMATQSSVRTCPASAGSCDDQIVSAGRELLEGVLSHIDHHHINQSDLSDHSENDLSVDRGVVHRQYAALQDGCSAAVFGSVRLTREQQVDSARSCCKLRPRPFAVPQRRPDCELIWHRAEYSAVRDVRPGRGRCRTHDPKSKRRGQGRAAVEMAVVVGGRCGWFRLHHHFLSRRRVGFSGGSWELETTTTRPVHPLRVLRRRRERRRKSGHGPRSQLDGVRD